MTGRAFSLTIASVLMAVMVPSPAFAKVKRAPAAAKVEIKQEARSERVSLSSDDLTRFRSACSKSEWWGFSSRVEASWRELYDEYLDGKMSPVRGFSEAMALRASAKNDEARLFGEFWASRALLDAELPHIAHTGFTSIAARDVGPLGKIVQIAALDCLLSIQRKIPTLSLTSKVVERLLTLQKNSVTFEAAGLLLRDQLSSRKPDAEIERTLKYLEGGGVHQMLAQGLWSAHRGRHLETISWFTRFLQDGGGASLRRYQDPVHLLMARAYYSLRQFDLAVGEWKAIQKSSNELSHALSELTWAYLKAEKYQEAVGTATNLQAAGLRNTFSPEAPMVMAMAFNELCYFPESLRAMRQLRDQYGKVYEWLQLWDKSNKGGTGPNLYALALGHLRANEKTGAEKPVRNVPVKIANEWVRSPLFYSRQEEINTLFSERRNTVALGAAGAREAKKMAVELLKIVREVKPSYLRARADTPGDQPLPEVVEFNLKKVRKIATAYRRLRRGAEPWKRILAYFDRTSPQVESRLVKEINSDIAKMNQRMLGQLTEVADNTRFIEVEIYNGASQDMVWQNAHPDFQDVAKQIQEESNRKPAGSGVWDWGIVAEGSAGSQEIWEDELGSYRAELNDNCSNREKYLVLKRIRRSAGTKGD